MAPTKRILFSAVRNEGPFLLEWVAYHRAIGFDTILIASNDCDDGTAELLDALQAAGVVRHLPHSVGPDASPQGRAAALANASGVFADGDWAIWLDADEFLNIHAGNGTLDALLDAIGPAEGMLIPWRLFGDGGNAAFPGRFVSARFIGAAAPDFAPNATIKTLFRHRTGATRLGETANHRPRLIDRTRYGATDFLTPAGQPIASDFPIHQRWLSGVEGKANFKIAPADFSWDLAQINHYMVRTPDVFALKRTRGRGFRNLKDGKARVVARHTDAFFATHNRNEATDRSILRFADATTAGMENLLRDPAVAAAQAATQALTRDCIAQAMAGPPTQPEPALSLSPTDVPPPPLSVPVVTLPDAERALVEQCYARAETILEYGSGGSTLIAAALPGKRVISVESDAGWARNIAAVLARDHPAADAHVHWEDIGPTKGWGRPRRETGWRGYHRYPLAVWDAPFFRAPDVVLIDGRFRVGCFMAVLLRITRPTVVLWDDYTPRRAYARVEKFAKPTAITGRMARFDLVPTPLPREDMTAIIGWFNDHD